MKPEDIAIIVGSESKTVPGSKQVECAVCHCPVWLSPNGQRMAEAAGAAVLCLEHGTTIQGVDQLMTEILRRKS